MNEQKPEGERSWWNLRDGWSEVLTSGLRYVLVLLLLLIWGVKVAVEKLVEYVRSP